jgi:hypothetical protein
MTIKIQRIDGTDYVVGSAEHNVALRSFTRRLDAAYLKARPQLVERNADALRRMERLSSRVRNDANAVAFLARELVFVRAAVERTVYEQNRAASFVPSEGHPRGATSYATELWDERGEAKIATDLSGDAPRADVSKSEDLKKYVNVRGAYAYSTDELEQAAFSGSPLQRQKAIACAEMIARGLDKIGRSGDSASGLTGFFNNPNVTVHTMTNGEWTSSATADEIVADFAEIEESVITAALDTQPTNYVLVVPSAVEARLTALKSSTGSDLNVKEYLLRNARLVKEIVRWTKLNSAVSPDVAASDAPQSILYPRDPGTLFWPMAISYEELAPQQRGHEFIVDARARCGGVEVRKPFNMLYVQNND